MLDQAFLETADFRTLTETEDFNFVVGRRGTGKSALYRKVTENFLKRKGYLTLAAKPQEYESLALQQYLARQSNEYHEMRAIARLAWRVHALLSVIPTLIQHYKLAGKTAGDSLQRHARKHERLLDDSSPMRVATIVRAATVQSATAGEVPAVIARQFDVSRLLHDVQDALAEINRKIVFFVDGLDEGWAPTPEATAVLGGLALAVADFDETQTAIHGTLFIRDNMFRALAHLDKDFSRHIEDSALRLHWDEHSLFDLVARRLRILLNLGDTENPEKVWNAYVAADLSGRDGFNRCLHNTLYRPRDVLVLLSRAAMIAQRRGDARISGEIINAAAIEISHDRLEDLVKEYDAVLPGLGAFTAAFEGRPAFESVGELVRHLEDEIVGGAYADESDSDFALLGSGKQVLFALYGVGFVGFEDRSRAAFMFCHDGSAADVGAVTDDLRTVVHPCYWKALELEAEEESTESVVVEINDEFDAAPKPPFQDLRIRQLGQIVTELPTIAQGDEDAGKFEGWVLRAVKLLFAGKLGNPALHPNADAIQRRDVVATNVAEQGLWKRIRESYGSRQVIFEVKNYQDLRPEDYRQVLSYTSGEYGSFAVIVHRGKAEGVSEKDRGWLRTLYHEHDRLILTIPEVILGRAVSKLRNADRHDYIEDQLSQRMDTFVRSYLRAFAMKRAFVRGGRRRADVRTSDTTRGATQSAARQDVQLRLTSRSRCGGCAALP